MEEEKINNEKKDMLKMSLYESLTMFSVGLGTTIFHIAKGCFKLLMMFGKLSIEIGKFIWKIIENMNKPKPVSKKKSKLKNRKKKK